MPNSAYIDPWSFKSLLYDTEMSGHWKFCIFPIGGQLQKFNIPLNTQLKRKRLGFFRIV